MQLLHLLLSVETQVLQVRLQRLSFHAGAVAQAAVKSVPFEVMVIVPRKDEISKLKNVNLTDIFDKLLNYIFDKLL